MLAVACGSTRTLPPASTPEPVENAAAPEPTAGATTAEPTAATVSPEPTATAGDPEPTVVAETSEAEPTEAEPTVVAATPEPEPAVDPEPAATAAVPAPPGSVSGSQRCLVYLHGKGGAGGDTVPGDDGVLIVSPSGNGTGWGALQWEYDSPANLGQAIASIRSSVDAADCGRVVVHGFSNGASMAAALHCSGDNLGGRLVGVVVDDPVPDAATVDCAPATDRIVLYWTGALALAAPAGTHCVQIDWTCAGDVLRPIDAYASDLGAPITASPHADHQWNFETDLPTRWLG